jgi:serine protease inhibitor
MKKILFVTLLLALVLALIISCDDGKDEETPSVPQPKIITQANGLAFDGTVTIKTSDPYTPAEWDALVANVITAFNAAYDGGGNAAKSQFVTVFANNANAQIVLVNNLDNNWEVRDGEFKTLYLKTGSIATANYRLAIQRMAGGSPSVGKATPPKGSAKSA